MHDGYHDTFYCGRFKCLQISEIICETVFANYLKAIVIDNVFYCFV